MNVELTKRAKDQLKKLPKREATKIARKLLGLPSSPFMGKRLTGKLQNHYSIRAWPYRILYIVDKRRNTIQIDAIEHRQSVYK